MTTPATGAFVGFVGVYDADGGLVGEASYVLGKLLGRRHCSLCDVTHSPVRRKPAWDAMVRRLGVPFRLAHRNELDGAESAAIGEARLPVVLGRREGSLQVVLSADQLDQAGASVTRFEELLLAATT